MNRKLGDFHTKPEVAEKISKIILKHLSPSFIIDPYAGYGVLEEPFKDIGGVLNDIDSKDIEELKKFNKYNIYNDDVLAYSAEELIEKWDIADRSQRRKISREDAGKCITPSSSILFYFNPPFGTSATNTLRDASVEKGKSRKIEIKYRDELIKYGKGDLCYPTIGQVIEMIKSLGSGYLAFYSPFDLFCGRVRYNKLLLELLSNFTFCEGIIISGEEFNNVAKDKPIAFTVWKLGGQTKHLDLVFDCYGKEVKLKSGFLLKEGWAYDIRDTDETTLYISPKAAMNEPSPPLFSIGTRKGDAKPYGSRVIKENVKKDLSFDI